jgi:Na+/pantothenate symporter
MGALIFYTAIYFLGYYAAHLLNQALGRMLIGNRRMAGLVLALAIGTVHGYKIISTPPPHDHGDGAGYALGLYVILPLTIITIAVLYLTWQDRQDNDIR